MDTKTQSDWDNHANQLNSNNDAYWKSRGFDEHLFIDDDDDYSDYTKVDDYNYEDEYFGEYTSFSWDFD